MIYAKKKVTTGANLAEQTARIIANVKELVLKKLIKLSENTVYLYPQIWKDKIVALNWMNCLHHYYVVKRNYKSSATLYFRCIETDELLGSVVNKKARVEEGVIKG